MDWKDVQSPLLMISLLLMAVQIGWIGITLRRNQRRKLGEPLSAMAFQRELVRIFSRAQGLS